MLKELVLMRHAHAAHSSTGQTDAQRPLSPGGQADALAAGAWLKATCAPPEVVLCSTAQRTRETLVQLVRAGCDLPAPEFEPRIYEASLRTLLAVIESRIGQQPAPSRLWLIGHNPGLEQMVFHLEDAARMHGMPPAGIACLCLDGQGAPTGLGAARIAASWTP